MPDEVVSPPDHLPCALTAQDLGGRWQLAGSVSEAWRFHRWHAELAQPVGAFARTAWIDACVPGSVHDDLLRAGLIRDPNFGLASLDAEWVSARQWVYRRTFRIELAPAARLHLCFEGVDYSAEVYLNGECLGTLAGTHTPARFNVSWLDRASEHLLVVVLQEPPAEAGQLGRTSRTKTLKPRAGYWWDFGARLVHVGLWRGVSLQADAGAAVLDVNPRVVLSDDLQRARVEVDLEHDGDLALPVTAELFHPDGRRERVTGSASSLAFSLEGPDLWWPAALGAQPLYMVRAWVTGSTPVKRRFGVRQVALVHNQASHQRGARPYTLAINHQPLYVRGFNMVPSDLIPGRAGVAERERTLVRYALAAHANLLRYNGVGPLASQAVLDACDECGLLVWQEMPLTSSGTDNVPPRSPAFLENLERDLPPLVRALRHHPSVVLLSAGNELTDAQRRPVTDADPTVARMAALIRLHDGTRPFLPSSPSGPEYDLSMPIAQERPHDLHDVHGPWHYRGVQDSYLPYTHNRALAHSEFGCQAASRESTLRRYLTDGPVWPMDDRNPQVVHHGEWWLMAHRIEEVFGPVEDLGHYVRLTQAAQADVLRHALGWNRARRGECSLALVWQLNEPWPNAHNTSVIDYDLKPKFAYYRCREANAPVALHLGLPAPVGDGSLCACPQVLADTAGSGRLTLSLYSVTGMTLLTLSRPVSWPAPGQPVSLPLSDTPGLLRAQLHGEDGTLLARTEQWIARAGAAPFAPIARLTQTTLSVEPSLTGVLIRNVGTYVAPWISVEAPAGVGEHLSDNGFALLPGEELGLRVSLDPPGGPANLTVQAINTAPVTLAWGPV
ncbi:glycoside hydrolase family 2 protein [Deinococcus humi]|uniref:Beta-mannosidase n=1 Tax=Deinococcus humi TaxID=662880 RepID=A0A7W8JT90_9DEIO|nr:glycoside hydrolase family 2 TIM barrel-domain containing protein [Deinococcus humi]MBB5362832.1 beta-mannosidase [Deinococcus humi]GGO26062.1 hypothetical protein GCM10008949_16470 [Deinococcus humi]